MDTQIQTRWWPKREILAGLMAAALLWAIPGPGLAQEDKILASGELEYQRYCVVCHGENAKGNGIMADLLLIKPADLTQLSKKNGGDFPFWRTYRIIDGREEIRVHGARAMPVWGDRFRAEEGEEGPAAWVDLARGRIWQLVYYLQSIQEK